MAVHTFQHAVRDVLQSDVEIFADVVVLADDAQQVHWELCGIGIMEANPFYAGNLRHALHEFCNLALMVEVEAIAGEFLSDDLKFVDSGFHHASHLVENILHRAARVSPRDEGYGAVGTLAVAALADFQIGVVARGVKGGGFCSMASCTWRRRLLAFRCLAFEVCHHLLPVEFAIEPIYLGHFLLQLLAVAFGEASHDEDALYLAVCLACAKV